MSRFTFVLVAYISITPIILNADEIPSVTGELINISSSNKQHTSSPQSTEIVDSHVLLELSNGDIYQLSNEIETPIFPSIVELDISPSETASGFPLVVAGRIRSIISIVDGQKNILQIKDPLQFRLKPSNATPELSNQNNKTLDNQF